MLVDVAVRVSHTSTSLRSPQCDWLGWYDNHRTAALVLNTIICTHDKHAHRFSLSSLLSPIHSLANSHAPSITLRASFHCRHACGVGAEIGVRSEAVRAGAVERM